MTSGEAAKMRDMAVRGLMGGRVSTLVGGRVGTLGDRVAGAEVLESGAVVPHPSLVIERGRVAGLIGHPGFGLTRIGLSMLADHAVTGTVAYLDVRGWLCPSAAWELGIAPERLVVVRCDDPVRWGRVAATLIDGLHGVYAEVPKGINDAQLRKLGALARTRRTPVILRPVRGDLPMGVTHLRLEAQEVVWAGTNTGHGKLLGRRVVLAASGKAMRGIPQTIEVEDHGAHALRVVSGLAAAPVGAAAG